MDRRSTIATLLGRKRVPSPATQSLSAGLEPYNGPWELAQAGHLLRRTTYCAHYENLQLSVQQGLDATLAELLADRPAPEPPLNHFFANDPNVPVGETWVNAPYSATENYIPYRNNSLYGWTGQLLLTEGISVREKMVLFWHNHFVTGGINEPRFIYDYSRTLREYALGNFREFTKAMTINPLMLRYLNGNQNTAEAPNENYSRELLELFTIGKGEPAGPGDYTTFTEDDVVQMARVLTGWRDTGFYDLAGNPVDSVFRAFRHDNGTKQLSHRFGNAVISNGGEGEFRTLIDIIFQQPEVARFISRKLYRWFVYYEISDTVETAVIEPMAQLLIDNDFEVKPVLEVLFRSAHFYESAQRGCMIKNPMDFVFNAFNQFRTPALTSLAARYELGLSILTFVGLQLMTYYNPPSVAGWPAYYQEPVYYQLWINSVSLPQRMQFSVGFVTTGFVVRGQRVIIDVLAFVDSINNPSDPDAMIREFVGILFAQELADNQLAYLKQVLLPGLPDAVWQEEYINYVAEPTNEEKAAPVRTKLQLLLSVMLTMPEYFLM